MIAEIERAGLSFVGKDESGRRMEVICLWKTCLMCDLSELGNVYAWFWSCCASLFCVLGLQIVELPNHPYFVGAQFHPEFKSRPGKPSALFLGKILSVII